MPTARSEGPEGETTGAPQATPSQARGVAHPHYDLSVDPAIQALDGDQLGHLTASVRELITHRINGINYAEGRRAHVAAIGGAIAAVGVALLPLGNTADWPPLRAAYIAFSILSVILGAAMWIIYAWQTNYDYPFKAELANWKWFYHQALPDKERFGPGLFRRRGKRQRTSEQAAFSEQWKTFTKQVPGLSDPSVDATQDLKQLYQLHVNERYKNLFLTQLRTVLIWGIYIIAIGSAVVFAGALLSVDSQPTSSMVAVDGVESQASWKATGAVRESGLSSRDVEYRVRIIVRNEGESTFLINGFVALDDAGDPIPVDFDVRPTGRISLSTRQSIEVAGYFWIASSERDSLDRVSVQ